MAGNASETDREDCINAWTGAGSCVGETVGVVLRTQGRTPLSMHTQPSLRGRQAPWEREPCAVRMQKDRRGKARTRARAQTRTRVWTHRARMH